MLEKNPFEKKKNEPSDNRRVGHFVVGAVGEKVVVRRIQRVNEWRCILTSR